MFLEQHVVKLDDCYPGVSGNLLAFIEPSLGHASRQS